MSRRRPHFLRFLSIAVLTLSAFAAAAGARGNGTPGEPDEEVVERWTTSPQVFEPHSPSRDRTVILLHGFGGSPYDLKPLAEGLRDTGFRIVVPVVPGETKRYSRRERDSLTAEDRSRWLSELVEEERSRYGRKPFLVGFSMGGTLATLEGVTGSVERLVLVSPFYALPWGDDFLRKVSRALASALPYVPKPWRGKVNDPEGYRRYHPGSYTVSLRGFLSLQDLARKARAVLLSGRPLPETLVLATPDDEVASFEVTEKLLREREDTRFLTFPGSNHILFYDYGAEEAIDAVRAFLLRGE